MNGMSVEKFIDVLQDLHLKIDGGFKGVYERIDCLQEAALERANRCSNKFIDIETKLAYKNGINNSEKEKRDFWKYIIRGTMLAMIVGLLGLAWKMFEIFTVLNKILPMIKNLNS